MVHPVADPFFPVAVQGSSGRRHRLQALHSRQRLGVIMAPTSMKASTVATKSTPTGKNRSSEKMRSNTAMRRLRALEASGRPYPMVAYKKCGWGAERRDFVDKLELDVQCAWLAIEERSYCRRMRVDIRSSAICTSGTSRSPTAFHGHARASRNRSSTVSLVVSRIVSRSRSLSSRSRAS